MWPGRSGGVAMKLVPWRQQNGRLPDQGLSLTEAGPVAIGGGSAFFAQFLPSNASVTPPWLVTSSPVPLAEPHAEGLGEPVR